MLVQIGWFTDRSHDWMASHEDLRPEDATLKGQHRTFSNGFSRIAEWNRPSPSGSSRGGKDGTEARRPGRKSKCGPFVAPRLDGGSTPQDLSYYLHVRNHDSR